MANHQDVINTILAEAGGSGADGMNAVAHVINNRAAARGLTPEQVVSQPHQFEGYSDPSAGGRANQNNPALRAIAEQVWDSVQSGQSPDPTGGALNYYGDYASPPAWAQNAPNGTVNIGGNVFLRGNEAAQPASDPVPLAPVLRNVSGPPDNRSRIGVSGPARAAADALMASSANPGGTGAFAHPPTVGDRAAELMASLPPPSLTQQQPAAPTGLGGWERFLSGSQPQSGVTRTTGGFAGTVQLPRDVRPNVSMPPMAYDTYGPGMGVESPMPVRAPTVAALAPRQAIMGQDMTPGGVPLPRPRPSPAVAAPAGPSGMFANVTIHPNWSMAPVGPVITGSPVNATNGYRYAPNAAGRYTRIGRTNEQLTPAEQYALLARAAAPSSNFGTPSFVPTTPGGSLTGGF